ncbi:TPA: hypothetical protein DCR49_08055 [Candidatus Delongbacteria bacterium]|nr:hypothetical protein [Candidatus Delongbacteria bacterium]
MKNIYFLLTILVYTGLYSITANGYVLLEGESDHTDIEVNFRMIWPNSAYSGPSVFTNSNGYYFINLEEMASSYEITMKKSGYITKKFSQYFASSGTVPTVILEEETGITGTSIPSLTELYQNYPNPFNPSTEINYSLKSVGQVTMSVFNTKGELVSQLVNAKKTAGNHTVVFNGEGLNSGIYFYRLSVNDKVVASKKMMMLK